MRELEALRGTDFDWVSHIDGVWTDPAVDVPEIHRKVRDELARRIDLLAPIAASPLGVPILGNPGAGKTHLLAALRRIAYGKQAGFVLLDMTDVNDFWATAQLGFLDALRRPGPSGRAQYVEILEHALLHHVGHGSGLVDADKLRDLPADTLARRIGVMVSELMKRFPKAMPYRDAIRALALHNSSDFELESIGYNWLQGLGIDPDTKARFGFAQEQLPASQVLRAMAWLLSLKGPVVVALDQLDAMVAEHHVAAGPRSEDPAQAGRQRRSLAIIEGIASGLMGLRDLTQRALLVPVCLEATWSILSDRALASALDRYDAPQILLRLDDGEALRKIVAGRLRPAFAAKGVAPRYESWPFAPQAFRGLQLTPRELLKRCSRHVDVCVAAGDVVELQSFTEKRSPSIETIPAPDELTHLDRRYAEAMAAADIATLKEREEELDSLLDLTCALLVDEQTITDGRDAVVDRSFDRMGKFEPLHTRIRLVHHDEGDREEHIAYRALIHDNPISFQSRLNAAITASGIDRELDFRKLRILRFGPVPGGTKTRETVDKLKARGGQIVAPSDQDLRAMRALAQLHAGPHGPHFDRWRKARRPASAIGLFREVCDWLFPGEKPQPAAAPSPARLVPAPIHTPAPAVVPVRAPAPAPAPKSAPSKMPAVAEPDLVPLGTRLLPGGLPGDVIGVRLAQLKLHTVVLAGAGSGKTVLVRRIVEEAALRGVPSIVLDVANDLATFGDRWPAPPDSWDAADGARADRFFASTETVIWTPGWSAGNPLRVEPLPDLAGLVDSPDDYAAALDGARGALEPWALGRGAAQKDRIGVLQSALDWFARHGRGGLAGFVAVLTDLPPEAAGGYQKAGKHAREMADSLRAELQTNPLLRTEGTPLDPAVLLGDAANPKTRTRISVLNLQGLATPDQQQAFVAHLATTLFSWIKAHPSPPGRPLRGLLVIDEAKDLVPSSKKTASGESLIRLANQARKYGLGLVLATQAPRSIDHNVIANCATQLYGRAASPAALEVIRDQLRARGAQGDDVAALTKGCFYAHSEGFAAPVKIRTRLSLSYHPVNPLDESGILERAARVRPSTFIQG